MVPPTGLLAPQRYGSTGCGGERIRADALEAAVVAALVELYADPDLIRAATSAQRQQAADDAHKHEQELAALEAELRKTEASVERYMLAFENGLVTDDMFGARIQELAGKAKALRARQAELGAALAASDAALPTATELEVSQVS